MSPILTNHAFDMVTHSPSQTHAVGARLGQLLGPGDLVCLQGELGTGKTCLTQGIGAGLAVQGIINSPTFVFVNEYPPAGDGPYLYHVDLYRITDHLDIYTLGLEDYIYGDGVTVIEWADRAIEVIPDERIWITLDYTDYMKRTLIFEATGERYIEIISSLKSVLYGERQ